MFWAMLLHMFLPIAVWLGLRWQRDQFAGDGVVRLRYNSLVRFAGWLLLILSPLLPMGIAIILQGKRNQDVWLIRSCFACAWISLLAGLFAWRETRYGFLVIGPQGIQKFSPWFGTTELAWKQIATAKISTKGLVSLSCADGPRLMLIPQMWTEAEEVMDAINKYVSAGAFVGI
jgi:hypothetical protein